jgi:hypothetical protein
MLLSSLCLSLHTWRDFHKKQSGTNHWCPVELIENRFNPAKFKPKTKIVANIDNGDSIDDGDSIDNGKKETKRESRSLLFEFLLTLSFKYLVLGKHCQLEKSVDNQTNK